MAVTDSPANLPPTLQVSPGLRVGTARSFRTAAGLPL